MRIGVTLPQFRSDPGPALEAARQAESAGISGVFVFDHLWPLGRPDRPALHSLSLLGALAAETDSVVLGTLVARVSLVPNAVLVHGLRTLHRMVGPRLVAGLGTGDRQNAAENLAYGRPFPPKAQRLRDLRWCAAELRSSGIPVWVGGRSAEIRQAAAEVGGWNCWSADAAAFTREAAEVRALGPTTELTWGGQVLIGRDQDEVATKLARIGTRPGLLAGTVDDLRRHLEALAGAGATWAVCAPLDADGGPEVLELLAKALPDRREVPGSLP